MNVIRWRDINLVLKSKKYREVASMVEAWYAVARKAKWENLEDVRKVFPTAQGVPVGKKVYTVFNIIENRFRLIVGINYQAQRLYFKHLLTHAEYDREEWKNK